MSNPGKNGKGKLPDYILAENKRRKKQKKALKEAAKLKDAAGNKKQSLKEEGQEFDKRLQNLPLEGSDSEENELMRQFKELFGKLVVKEAAKIEHDLTGDEESNLTNDEESDNMGDEEPDNTGEEGPEGNKNVEISSNEDDKFQTPPTSPKRRRARRSRKNKAVQLPSTLPNTVEIDEASKSSPKKNVVRPIPSTSSNYDIPRIPSPISEASNNLPNQLGDTVTSQKPSNENVREIQNSLMKFKQEFDNKFINEGSENSPKKKGKADIQPSSTNVEASKSPSKKKGKSKTPDLIKRTQLSSIETSKSPSKKKEKSKTPEPINRNHPPSTEASKSSPKKNVVRPIPSTSSNYDIPRIPSPISEASNILSNQSGDMVTFQIPSNENVREIQNSLLKFKQEFDNKFINEGSKNSPKKKNKTEVQPLSTDVEAFKSPSKQKGKSITPDSIKRNQLSSIETSKSPSKKKEKSKTPEPIKGNHPSSTEASKSPSKKKEKSKTPEPSKGNHSSFTETSKSPSKKKEKSKTPETSKGNQSSSTEPSKSPSKKKRKSKTPEPIKGNQPLSTEASKSPSKRKGKTKTPEHKIFFKNNMPNNRGSDRFRRDSCGVSQKEEESTTFPDYIEDMKLLEQGLRSRTFVEGSIRINPKNFKEAYVSSPVKMEMDIVIEGILNRNRALDGDIVIIQILPIIYNSTTKQKTGKVVYIKENYHPRLAIGYLKLMPDKNHQMAAFSPRDSKIPRIRVPFTDWPANFYHEPQQYEDTLFLVKIIYWGDTRYALGTIIEQVGQANDLKVETMAILKNNNLDGTPHPPEMNVYFPDTSEIPEEEFTYREDLRKSCIFTIDPLTARDLDDALSVTKKSNGNYEIGVHISDVSFYLKEGTPLDDAVARKATTIYLVDSVYHMLPKELCMMCSLLPGEDRLAFSVFWEFTPEHRIASYRFHRTILNSCCQLAYEHVQEMLEKPKNNLNFKDFPKLFGGHKYDDIYDTVHILNNLAVRLRANRFDNGALRINQPKLSFRLNPENGLPESFSMYNLKESHSLIEEFMLLANITVATVLKNKYPDIAFLRRHPPPIDHLMSSLKENLEKLGLFINVTSAGTLHQSMQKYSDTDLLGEARMAVLNALCAKPMARALYFCASTVKNIEDLWHYALNVPLYTHFTSPIRRYPDIMVHRLLAAMMGYREKPNWAVDDLKVTATICNTQKYTAKKAGEQSMELYLTKYIELNQPVKELAVVIDIKDKFMTVIVMGMGINVRIQKNQIPAVILNDQVENLTSRFTVEWKNEEGSPMVAPMRQVISVFTVLQVELTVKMQQKTKKIEAKVMKPN